MSGTPYLDGLAETAALAEAANARDVSRETTPAERGEFDPVDTIEWVPASTLHANPWNPNRVHKAELRLLERSLLATGWLQPLLVNPGGLIIDGFHRWRLAQDSKACAARWAGMVPVAVLDVDTPTAMLMTVRINRAKGVHVALEMHHLVHALLEEHGLTVETIMAEMGATRDEVEALAAEGLFAARGTANHAYSPAWYPVEDGRSVRESRDDLKTKRAGGPSRSKARAVPPRV